MLIPAGYDIRYETSAAIGIASMRATTARRIGRVLMARGCEVTNTALTTSLGPARLVGVDVHTDAIGTIA
ncbi:hypothetical protein SAMN03159340_00092 [Sphingomonas sp. NFR15]|nr:hypothetical protein SAMN03159340_00092 [Sphingomonas sp. NFR15]